MAAMLLHGLLFALLTGGVQCSRKPQGPVVIRAVLMDPGRKQIAADKLQQKLAEEQRRKALEQKQKEDAARKQKEQEAARKKAEEEQKRQAWVAKQKADQQKKEDEARKKKELEEKRKADELARKKKAQQDQQDLAQAMEQEDQQRQSAKDLQAQQQKEQQQEAALNAKRAEWSDVLSEHIRKHWNKPAAPGHFPCTIHVKLLPDGTVTDAKVVDSCGNPVVDRSIEEAAYRSSPMPRPEDASAFDRDLNIEFKEQ